MRTESQKKYNLEYYRRTTYAPRYHKRWDEQEDVLVLLHHFTDTELAYLIDRSVSSIQKRRGRLKKRGEAFCKNLIQKYV